MTTDPDTARLDGEIATLRSDFSTIKKTLDDHVTSTLPWRAETDAKIGRIECNTKEIVDLFKGAKAATNALAVIGKGIKWTASVGGAAWAIWYLAKNGAWPDHIP